MGQSVLRLQFLRPTVFVLHRVFDSPISVEARWDIASRGKLSSVVAAIFRSGARQVFLSMLGGISLPLILEVY
jgi:hypothetical protein